MSKPRRTPKILTSQANVYLEPDNLLYARVYGKKLFGSASAYINALIAKDRGVKPKVGKWRTPGEAKTIKSLKRSKKGRLALGYAGIDLAIEAPTAPPIQKDEVSNEVIETKKDLTIFTPEPVSAGSDYEGIE